MFSEVMGPTNTDKTCSFCFHCPVCHDVTVLVVLFVVAVAGQLGAAGRYEPLALAEMQSGNNFHRLELHAQKMYALLFMLHHSMIPQKCLLTSIFKSLGLMCVKIILNAKANWLELF